VEGIHGGEEVGGGFVMGAGLMGDPMQAQAVVMRRNIPIKSMERGLRTRLKSSKWLMSTR
jgi:hypothetical protein